VIRYLYNGNEYLLVLHSIENKSILEIFILKTLQFYRINRLFNFNDLNHIVPGLKLKNMKRSYGTWNQIQICY